MKYVSLQCACHTTARRGSAEHSGYAIALHQHSVLHRFGLRHPLAIADGCSLHVLDLAPTRMTAQLAWHRCAVCKRVHEGA